MTVKFADRVFETSTTQGTGTINLAGPAEAFRSFVEGVGTGAKAPYVIDDGEDWEIGLGTITDGTPDTLSRDTVFASSNSNGLVNWGPGTRNVRLAPVTALLVQRDENLNVIDGYVIGAGSATVQTGELSPVPLALSTGMSIIYRPPAANTGALTLNLNSLGAKAIKLPNGSDPHANAILTTGIYELVYNGTSFVLLNPSYAFGTLATKSSVNTEEMQGGTDNPGNSKYYGTDPSGAKGFHSLPTPKVVQRAYVSNNAYATDTTGIPFDDTLPQNNEGSEFLSQAFTPLNAANILRITVTAHLAHSTGVRRCVAAAFRSGQANTIGIAVTSPATSNYLSTVTFVIEVPANSTTVQTFTARFGADSSGTCYLNGQGGARQYGGALVSSMVIEELAA